MNILIGIAGLFLILILVFCIVVAQDFHNTIEMMDKEQEWKRNAVGGFHILSETGIWLGIIKTHKIDVVINVA